MSSTAHQTTPGTAVAAPLTPFGKLAELPANQMPPTQLSLNPKIERITSVIQKGAFFSGSMELPEGVKVDGLVNGDITFGTDDGLCVIARTGVVRGNIKGPRILVDGRVEGDLEIDGVCFLSPNAIIEGNITAGTLLTLNGAEIEGRVRTNRNALGRDSAGMARESVRTETDQTTSARLFKLPFGRKG